MEEPSRKGEQHVQRLKVVKFQSCLRTEGLLEGEVPRREEKGQGPHMMVSGAFGTSLVAATPFSLCILVGGGNGLLISLDHL